jgi:DNA-directed DNA polymerase III PolC
MIPLATHSHYSLLAGTASPDKLCRAAKKLGYRQIALTDCNSLYGLIPFLNTCQREEITPIIGAELSFRMPVQENTGRQPRAKRIFLLAKNAAGYRNLCRIITARHLQPEKNLSETIVSRHHGLLLLSCEPELLRDWHEKQLEVYAALPLRMDKKNHTLYRLAESLGVPAVAVPDSFFPEPEEFTIHQLLRAIAAKTTLSALPAQSCCSPEAWLAPSAVYADRFSAWPELTRNTFRLAEQCVFRGPDRITVMPPYSVSDSSPTAVDRELHHRAYAGAARRYGTPLPAAVEKRLREELAVISQMNFSSYFLVVRDIVPRASRTCGRGSAAASLVSYCLGLTNVCPVKHDLYFARFLNPGRRDPPDIDIDFAWDERDRILAALLENYGDHAAMVSSHVLLQPRMAIRECARIFGLTDGEIGRVTKRLPWLWRSEGEENNVLDRLSSIPNLRDFDFSEPWPEILRSACRIIGAPRHLSVHPGGVIITPRPVADYVPVERAAKGVPIIQWDKDAAEEAGLVKIDLLGNRSLGVIRDAIANLRDNGEHLDEQRWQPEDDGDTRRTIARGKTMGCFYIESPSMRLLQKKSQRGDFAHLVIHSSIIRPAANEFIREYIRRLHGGAWQPLHPLLADVLGETFGIMVYQEDVSRVAEALAGFSTAEADGLRKILSKKDRFHRLRDYEEKFISGCRRHGLQDEQIGKIWRMMLSFDGYSFCKPHSASYAKVSFQAAWLKSHFPAEFMAAVISNGGGYYSTFAYVSEARRMGLIIRRPDIRESLVRWTGRKKTVQIGLMAVKGLSRETMLRIIEKRKRRPFSSCGDFLERVQPSLDEARSLVHAGALDAFVADGNRPALLWLLAGRQKRRTAGNAGLFSNHPDPPAPRLPPETALTRYRREFMALGFLADLHPLALFADHPLRRGTIRASELHCHAGKKIRLAGWLISGKTVSTRHGEQMEFITFEDETALVESIFFPDVYRRYCHLLSSSRPYLLEGLVEEDYGAVTLTVCGLKPIR